MIESKPSLKELLGRSLQFFKRAWSNKKNVRIWSAAMLSLLVVFVAAYAVFFKSPGDFEPHTLVRIEKGSSLAEISQKLQSEGVIKSPFWFRNFVVLFSGQGGAVAGDYYFEDRSSVITVARRIGSGRYNLTPVKITVPEGSDSREIAKIIQKELPEFDAEEFINLAKGKEGYLFPDTYLFPPNVEPKTIIETMEQTFSKRILTLASKFEEFNKSLKDVVIMASLIEEEARTLKTRRTIAGILWKRLEIGMPLQVDAVFPYILGKNTYEVTTDDLSYDSPYNTYKYRGLPPGPITNPGLESLEAALTPIKTDYLYYLSDKAGRMYYGTTFEEHVSNRQYLDRR